MILVEFIFVYRRFWSTNYEEWIFVLGYLTLQNQQRFGYNQGM